MKRNLPAAWAAAAVIVAAAMFLSACQQTSNTSARADNSTSGAAEHDGHAVSTSSEFKIPGSLSAEHSELHEQLEAAVKSGGATAEAARLVEERLAEHFKKEEQYALPQLGLLKELAEGKTSPEMKPAVEMADKLKAEMPQMMAEHKAIVEALDGLAAAATKENKPDVVHFTEKLKLHAQNEEEILYPAAILIGDFLRLRLK